MKIAVIGGGSTYTPELVQGLLDRARRLAVEQVWLMDIDRERLEIVGDFARRMNKRCDQPFEIHLTDDRRAALQDADYVITQIRVGGMAARREDEYLGQRHGLIGQETTGVGGMAKALRTIPVILEIARAIQELAPEAVLFNFTNPSGLITEALARFAPQVTAVGLCNSPITTRMDILDRLQKSGRGAVDPQTVQLDALGLNHLAWYRGFTLEGEDLWPEVLGAYIAELESSENRDWSPQTIQALGMIPNYYLQYYYNTKRKLREQESWPPSRAEQVMAIEAGLLRQYADPALDRPPDDLMKRGGAYYATLATQLLESHSNDISLTEIMNVRHNGAVSGWSADWVLELPCRVDRWGFHPLPAEPLPPVCSGLLAQVKAYELLTVQAAVHGDRAAAYEALLAHPLGPSEEQVQNILDDLLNTHRAYLPLFWK